MPASLSDLASIADVRAASLKSPLGVLVGFVTTEDPHSAVVLHHYDEVESHFHGALPLLLLETYEDDTKPLPQAAAVYSVPTLAWVKYENPVETNLDVITIHTRHVGTTTAKKIIADIEAKLDELLDD